MSARRSLQVPEEAGHRMQALLSRWKLPPDFLAELIARKAPVTFAKGESIFLQGSAADVAYWILSGRVKVYRQLADGTRIITRIAGPGDFLGTIGAGLTGRRVQALNAKAMTRVSLAIFTREHVMALLKTLTPEALVAILEEVNAVWSEEFSWWIDFLGLSFRERLRRVFQYLASRYGVKEARGILLTPELSHDDLAEMISSSRAMVSHLVAEFVERGEIIRQGKHYLLPGTVRAPESAPETTPKKTDPV